MAHGPAAQRLEEIMTLFAPSLALMGRRKLPEIRQTEQAECTLACLAMIAGFHRRRIELNALRRQYPVSLKGATLRTLMNTAAELGFTTRPVKLALEHLRELPTP